MKRLLRLAALVCIPSALFAQPPGAMFRGDLAHTGVYAGAVSSKLGTVKWKFHTGAAVYSSPVLSGGLLFAGSSDRTTKVLGEVASSLTPTKSVRGSNGRLL